VHQINHFNNVFNVSHHHQETGGSNNEDINMEDSNFLEVPVPFLNPAPQPPILQLGPNDGSNFGFGPNGEDSEDEGPLQIEWNDICQERFSFALRSGMLDEEADQQAISEYSSDDEDDNPDMGANSRWYPFPAREVRGFYQ
jgi:hypothetical protein